MILEGNPYWAMRSQNNAGFNSLVGNALIAAKPFNALPRVDRFERCALSKPITVRFGHDASSALEPLEVSPRVILEDLKGYVIGQEATLRKMALFAYEHIVRIQYNRAKDNAEPIDTTGESSLARNLSRTLPQNVTAEHVKTQIEKYYDSNSAPKQQALYLHLVQYMTTTVQGYEYASRDLIKHVTMKLKLAEDAGLVDRKPTTIHTRPPQTGLPLNQEGRNQLFARRRQERLPHATLAEKIVKQLLRESRSPGSARRTQVSRETQPVLHERPMLKAIQQVIASGEHQDVDLEKTNLLVIGPTGSGKTHMKRVLCKVIEKYTGLQIPYISIDTSQLTQAGYKGLDVDEVALRLYKQAGMDMDKAQYGLIFFDEVDKKRRARNSDSGLDVSGEGAQGGLLSVLEDGEIVFEVSRGGAQQVLPTKNIGIVGMGAFVGLDKIIAKRLNVDQKTLGFLRNEKVSAAPPPTIAPDDMLSHVTRADLKEFGLMDELVGRWHIVAPLKKLGVSELKDIIEKPKNSLLSQISLMLKLSGVEVEFTPEALEEMAKYAYEQNVGARALRTVIDTVTEPFRFHLPKGKKQVVTKEFVQERLGILPSTTA